MTRVTACLLAAVCCAALAAGAPAPREGQVVERMERGKGFAKRGEVDLFVAATAVWNLAANDERLWAPPLALGAKAFEKADLTGDREPHGGNPVLFSGFAEYRQGFKAQCVRTDVVYARRDTDDGGKPIVVYAQAIQAAGVAEPQSLSGGLVVSRGPVSSKVMMHSSLVLANGDVTAGHKSIGSVIICDGDVLVGDNASKFLIIARGNVVVKGKGSAGVIIAGGTVRVGEIRAPVNANEAKSEKLVIQEKEANPLGFITFFELRRVGLEAKAAGGAVTVAAVKAGSAGEKAGLKTGDVVLDVGGKKPADAESLRRLLRDALAVGDAEVKVKRGDATHTVKLALPE